MEATSDRDRLEYLANLDKPALLREITRNDIPQEDHAAWPKVFELLVEAVMSAVSPRVTRAKLFDVLCERDPEIKNARPGFTLHMFNRKYKDADWLELEFSRHLALWFIDNGHTQRAYSRWQKDGEVRDDPDRELYKIFVRRAGVDDKLLREMGFAASGTYQLWRHSTTIPGHYVKGIIKIESKYPDPIYVRSEQLLNQRKKRDGYPTGLKSRKEQFVGYLVPLSKDCCLLIGRGVGIIGFRLIIFTTIAPVPRQDSPEPAPFQKIFSMMGCTMGTGDNRGFFSPIYIERLEENEIEQHRNEMDIWETSKIPPEVVAILSKVPMSVF